jgi:hypothetical protein
LESTSTLLKTKDQRVRGHEQGSSSADAELFVRNEAVVFTIGFVVFVVIGVGAKSKMERI